MNANTKRSAAIITRSNNRMPSTYIQTTRAPFLDLPTNRAVNRRAKSVSNAVEAIFKHTREVARKSQENAIIPKHARTNVTYRNLTPNLTYDDDDDDDEEVFFNGTDYIAFMAGIQASRNERTSISPIISNTYTRNETLVTLKDPESRVIKGPSVKKSLLHKANLGKYKTSTTVIEYDEITTILIDGEYVEGIIDYLMRREKKYVQPHNFLDRFNPDFAKRTVIVSYMQKFQKIFAISSTALFASVSIFDHILSLTTVPTNMYMLIAIVSLQIATKVDGSSHIRVSKILALCGNAYTMDQFLKMERKILRIVQFDLLLPDPIVFITYYLKYINMDSQILQLSACYILECFLLNKSFSTMSVSLVAAAATYTALTTLYPSYRQKWNYCITHYNSQNLENIKAVMMNQIKVMRQPNSQYNEPYKKYSTEDYRRVSLYF